MLFQYYTTGGGGAIQSLMQSLIDWGFLDALLPFLLIFVLIFAILQKIALFKKDDTVAAKRISAVLAGIIAAMIVIPHVTGLYPVVSDPIIMINTFLPSIAVILLAMLCVILLLGLAGTKIPNFVIWAIALVALGFLLFVIFMAIIPGWFPAFDFLRDPAIQALIIILLVIGLVGFFLTREETGGGGATAWMTKWLGGP